MSEEPVGRSRLRRALRWVVAGSAVVVIVLVAAAWILFATTAGARFAIGQGLARSPVPVSIERVDGALLGPLTLAGVQVDYYGATARVDEVLLEWRLRPLSRGVEVEMLHVSGVDVFVPADFEPPPPDEGPPPREGPIEVPELPIDVVVDDVRIEVARVVLEDRAEVGPSVFTLAGTLSNFEATADVNGAAQPIDSFAARATMRGAPDAYTLESDLEFTGAELPPVSASLRSTGSLSDIDVSEAVVRTANGEARATVRAAWYPEVTWDLTAQADGFEVAPFAPEPEEWPGSISFRAETQGRMTDDGPEATLTVDGLSGTLREQPLSGGVDVRTQGATEIDVDRLQLTWGGIEVDAEGAVLEALDLTFALDVPDLGLALPGATGTIRMEGSLAGDRTAPHVVATFEASDVSMETTRLARADGDIDLDLTPGATSDVRVTATGLASGETPVDSITLTAVGTREQHDVRLHGWMPTNALAVALRGGLSEADPTASGADLTGSAADATGSGAGAAGSAADASGSGAGPTDAGAGPLAWNGSLDSLSIDTELAGAWTLAGPAPLYAAADSASLGEACVGQLTASLCVEGGWRREGAAAGDVRIEGLPLALLASNLPDGTTIEGTLEGAAEFAMAADGRLSADGTFTTEGALEATVGAETARFSLGGDGLSLAVDDTGARLDADFALLPEVGSGSFEMTAAVTLPGYNTTDIAPEDQTVEGRLEAGSEDLAFLSVFTPALTEATGRMNLEADVSGTMAEPAIRGSLRVEDAEADVPELGLQLRDLQLTAEGSPDGGIDIDGSLASGDGTFRITGRSPTVPTTDEPARIELVGEQFLAMNTPEIQVVIEPDLDIAFDGSLTTVEGTLAIPWARVELVEVPEVAVPPSPDVEFVDEEPAPPPEVSARVQISVGDDVQFQGFGFNSSFEGDLDVREEPGNVPLVFGELNLIGGRFAAYGQNLDVDPGRLLFSGPGEDGSLDVTALRTAQDGTVAGLVVTGSMIDPDIVITSEPAMSDADALSYIIYGKPLSDGDPSQQQRVAGAAATLGANVLTTKLAGSVGLDEARIEGATRDQAELVAGKYLTPSIFVSYGFGLFNPSSTFRVKYLLSSNWALQAESGDANGGDVLYQIERGN